MRRSIRILGDPAGKYVSAISATKARPSPDPAASYPKGQRMAEIVQVRPPGLVPLPVPEAAHGPPPSWSSRVLGAALASCRRLILSLQTRHVRALDDHLLRDIGLWRDRIQPSLLTVLAARHLRRW
jgi:hypothetical protein